LPNWYDAGLDLDDNRERAKGRNGEKMRSKSGQFGELLSIAKRATLSFELADDVAE
jgi:hypothetical protein